MSDTSQVSVQATCVAVDGRGVLIRGAPGAGKSSLALAVLHARPGAARLVGDDRLVLRRRGDRIDASAPAATAGLIEVRGQGIVSVPHVGAATVRLVVDLRPAADIPRLPDERELEDTLLGIVHRRVFVDTRTPYGPALVAVALADLGAGAAGEEQTAGAPAARMVHGPR